MCIERTEQMVMVVAYRKDFECHELLLDTTAEVVACKIFINGQRPLIVCSMYRPPDRSVPYSQEMCRILDRIISDNPDDVIWLAGDINLPNIEWDSSCITSSKYPVPLCEVFMDLINMHSLTQVVDHEIVYVESYIKAPIQRGYKKKLYNWSKADLVKLKQDFIRFSDKFLNDYSTDTPINELWKQFKQACTELLQQIPKISPDKRKPWITTNIKRLSRQNQHHL